MGKGTGGGEGPLEEGKGNWRRGRVTGGGERATGGGEGWLEEGKGDWMRGKATGWGERRLEEGKGDWMRKKVTGGGEGRLEEGDWRRGRATGGGEGRLEERTGGGEGRLKEGKGNWKRGSLTGRWGRPTGRWGRVTGGGFHNEWEVVEMTAMRHQEFCCLQELCWEGRGARKMGGCVIGYKFFWMGYEKGIHEVWLLEELRKWALDLQALDWED